MVSATLLNNAVQGGVGHVSFYGTFGNLGSYIWYTSLFVCLLLQTPER